MAAMVFLKITADVAFLFFMLGPIAVRFGAGPWTCVITCALAGISHVISYLISERKSALRFIPYVIPLAALLLPGISISWAIVCGMILAYAVFCGATLRYVPDDEQQKTLFKVTLIAMAVMLVILLLFSASGTSYRIVIFGGLISASCSVLIMRSLRHDEQVFSRPAFQAINIAAVAGVIILSVLLSTRAVLNGILTVLKTVYTGVAYVVLYILTFIVRAVISLVRWISSIIGEHESAVEETEPFVIDQNMAEDIFGDKIEGNGLPGWVKITGLVIVILIVIAILYFIFRRLAGARSRRAAHAGLQSSLSHVQAEDGRRKWNGQVQGVRKQYRKYLNLIESEGGSFGPDETTKEISDHAPETMNCTAADELRNLYLEARYNGEAGKEAAERAKELYREIKKGLAR